MVSQQVIIPGVEVIILPIHQQATHDPVEISKNGNEFSTYGFANTVCYPTAFWGYAGPMIKGQYDDYGCFKILETVENNVNLLAFFNYLLKESFVTKQGENKFHDHSFDMNSLIDITKEISFEELVNIWDKVWEVAQENRIFIADYNGNPRNLQFAVIHHFTADYLIESVNQSTSYDKSSYEQKTYFKTYIQAQLDRRLKVFEKKKELEDIFSFFTSQIASLSNFVLGDQEGCYLSQFYDNWDTIMNAFDEFTAKNKDVSKLSNELIDNLFELFKPQIDHRYLHVALDRLNLKLSPMVYTSQDYDNETGKAYAKMILSVSSKVNK